MILRPPSLARRGMVVASHPMAAEAGVRMLRAGGHAVDAAIAAGAVLSVVEPSASGLRGDAFLLTWDRSDGLVSAINGSGAAPYGRPPFEGTARRRGDVWPGRAAVSPAGESPGFRGNGNDFPPPDWGLAPVTVYE